MVEEPKRWWVTHAEIMRYARLVVLMIIQLRRTRTRGVSSIYFNRFGVPA